MYFTVFFQGVYKTYDTDGSGVIGADELPNAFRAAGKSYHVAQKHFGCLPDTFYSIHLETLHFLK